MVRMLLRLTTRPADTEGAIRALQAIALAARIERACVRCDLCVDVESRDTLVYSEEWASEEDLHRQVRSDRFVRMLSLMELAEHPPELEFSFVSRTRGLDYVEAVKGPG